MNNKLIMKKNSLLGEEQRMRTLFLWEIIARKTHRSIDFPQKRKLIFSAIFDSFAILVSEC